MAEVETDWSAVIGRSLAFLCLHHGDMRDKTLVEQSEFLDRLGVPTADQAPLLGTNSNSLRVMRSQAKKRSAEKAPAKRAVSKNGKR
jgi:hypothetical protein